jgi:hypothetical protein
MEPAIKTIVDTYVRLGNRRAVEDLLMHRRRLSIDLRGRSGGYDYSRPIEQIDAEIRIIADALQKFEVRSLTAPPAPIPRTIPDLAAS